MYTSLVLVALILLLLVIILLLSRRFTKTQYITNEQDFPEPSIYFTKNVEIDSQEKNDEIELNEKNMLWYLKCI